MDYDAFHLRLIAKIINYKTPSESFHKYLGKQYFKSDKLTSEQYSESKKITFRILYGGLPDIFLNYGIFILTKVILRHQKVKGFTRQILERQHHKSFLTM